MCRDNLLGGPVSARWLDTSWKHHLEVFRRLKQDFDTVEHMATAIANCLEEGGKLLICGNGGSAADSQHIAAEFVGRFVANRRPLAAIALTTDTSILTAIANDYSYEEVFSRQVQALGASGDALLCISTSGQSPNVLKAAREAKSNGLIVLGLTGIQGEALTSLCDYSVLVGSRIPSTIQECHIFLGQALCGLVELNLQGRGLLGAEDVPHHGAHSSGHAQ